MQYTTRSQSEKIRGHIIWSTKSSLPKNKPIIQYFIFFNADSFYVGMYFYAQYVYVVSNQIYQLDFLTNPLQFDPQFFMRFFSFLLGSRNQKLFVNVRIEPKKTFLNQYFLHHFFNFVQRKMLSCQSIFRKKGSGERQANAHLKN